MPELIQYSDSWNFDMEDFIDLKKNCQMSPTYCLCSRGFVHDRGHTRCVSPKILFLYNT